MTGVESDPVLAKYSRLAACYDRRWAFYIGASIQATLRRLPLRGGERVLDVGCGTGALLSALADLDPTLRLSGADPCPQMLELARRRLSERVALHVGAAESLPAGDATFDLVVSTSAFHYFRRPEAALAEMFRVLAPGGWIAITDWCHDYWTCRVCNFLLRRFHRAHESTYRASECASLLEAAGFADVNVERYRLNWFWGLMTARGRKR